MLEAQWLDVPEAKLLWCPGWLDQDEASLLAARLQGGIEWRQDQMTLFGKTHPLPRLQAMYGDAGTRYDYSGMGLEALAWRPDLVELRTRLEADLHAFLPGVRFNSVLCNLYRDGRDSNGWHADDEAELGADPVIASVSLGATRRFRLRHRQGGAGPLTLDLPPGSLLVMAGSTQSAWQHTLTKTARPVGSRINLTYRLVQPLL